jgi:hypothetical protein
LGVCTVRVLVGTGFDAMSIPPPIPSSAHIYVKVRYPKL